MAAAFLAAGLAALPAGLAAAPIETVPVAARYRAVLQAVAVGDQERAVDELETLENGLLGDRPQPRSIEEFWRLKLGVVAEVLQDSPPEVLIPVILLHHDVYLRHRDARRWLLANHARIMATELVEFYLQRPQAGADAAVVASRVLTSFAGYLQEGWSLGLAAGLFRRALELDGRNEAAVVGMAVSFEKLGRYAEALEHLERAAVLAPENPQVRLRLALCLKRTGEEVRAASELGALLAGEPPQWILALAYQELVDLRIGRGELAVARRRAAEGLERLPDDPHLPVQMALLLDRDRKRAEATRLVEALQPGPWGEESARYRYTRWPQELLGAMREELRSVLSAKLQPLQLALARPPAEVSGS